jgi:hypothetical protein
VLAALPRLVAEVEAAGCCCYWPEGGGGGGQALRCTPAVYRPTSVSTRRRKAQLSMTRMAASSSLHQRQRQQQHEQSVGAHEQSTMVVQTTRLLLAPHTLSCTCAVSCLVVLGTDGCPADHSKLLHRAMDAPSKSQGPGGGTAGC